MNVINSLSDPCKQLPAVVPSGLLVLLILECLWLA